MAGRRNGSGESKMDSVDVEITGPEQAVLFLLSLDEEVAGPIINQLDVEELKRLREVAATMNEVTASSLNGTYEAFVKQADRAVAVPRGGLTYLKRLTEDTFGVGVANEVFEDGTRSPMERLEAAPPEAVAQLLINESSQLIAAVLAQLDPAVAYGVLAAFPQEREAEILTCMGKMTELPAGVLEHVAHAIANELPTGGENMISLDGIQTAAEILKEAGREISTEILEKIEEDEPDMARDMRLAMFTFEELKMLDQRSMRTLLREVATDRLTTALKGASEDVARAIYAGLSQRAAKLIKDDLEVLGKVRKSDVEAARQDVVQVAMRLEAEGAIDLGRGDE